MDRKWKEDMGKNKDKEEVQEKEDENLQENEGGGEGERGGRGTVRMKKRGGRRRKRGKDDL